MNESEVLIMYAYPIGVIIDSFRTDIPTAVRKAANVGAQGIQVYATRGEMAPENLVGSKRAACDLRSVRRSGRRRIHVPRA